MRSLSWPVVLLVFAGCQFEASCGSKGKNLNLEKGREFVSTTLERELGQKPASVTCPGPVKIEKDKPFECTASYGPAIAKVHLVQTDDKGGVTIKDVTGVLIASKLEAQIADQLGKKHNVHLEVACGERVRKSVPGDKFTCDAKDAQGKTGKIAVVVEDDNGKVQFAVEQPTPAAPEPPAAPAP